jgi:hypothetical protein
VLGHRLYAAGSVVNVSPGAWLRQKRDTRVAVLNKRSSEIFVERENEYSPSELN